MQRKHFAIVERFAFYRAVGLMRRAAAAAAAGSAPPPGSATYSVKDMKALLSMAASAGVSTVDLRSCVEKADLQVRR